MSFTFDEFADHDLVITTYETLRGHPSVFKKVHWHRVVLGKKPLTYSTQLQGVLLGGRTYALLKSFGLGLFFFNFHGIQWSDLSSCLFYQMNAKRSGRQLLILVSTCRGCKRRFRDL